MLQQTEQGSLQKRVNEYLRNKPLAYATEESHEAASEAVFQLLQQAERELEEAQERVDRLKWELAKAQS